jgi:uncharacterized membrane protein (UPF0127 family)
MPSGDNARQRTRNAMNGQWIRRLSLGLALLVALPGMATALETFARSALVVQTAGGGNYRFSVEVAQTPGQQAQGLMFRETMAADAGMVFVYASPQPVAFWMKNTLIPLDMLFVGVDGRVVNIHERAVPGVLDGIPSAGPVTAVVEINGGMAARLGIRPGDRVVFPAPAGH